MFKKTRLRIVGLIMIIATVVIVLMLSIIFYANSRNSFERSIGLLESYMDERGDGFGSAFEMPPEPLNRPQNPKEKHDKMLRLSTFYSVNYDLTGNAIKINYGDGKLYTEQDILAIANNILKAGNVQGKYNQMPFLVRQDSFGIVVAMIDNTMEQDNFDKLFSNSIVVGILAWLVILFLAWYFSKRIVYPLEQNDKKQKQFISDAGHELKTPISVISANADLLAMEVGENQWLSNIQYENERMGDLVKQLLELMRAENMQSVKETLDFSHLVSGGVLPFEGVAFEQGLSIQADIEENITVDGNQSQLSQLISILLDNAISHGKNGKEIAIKLSSTKSQAVLSVVNNAPPISDEERHRLFERFYRADEARTEESGHYGLGLAIAKAIAVAHNGKLEVSCYDGLVEFRFAVAKK